MRIVLRGLLNGYDYVVIYLGLAWLGLLCLAWTPIALISYPLLPASRGRALGRYVITVAFRLYLASMRGKQACMTCATMVCVYCTWHDLFGGFDPSRKLNRCHACTVFTENYRLTN
jgi:hypothetical protein